MSATIATITPENRTQAALFSEVLAPFPVGLPGVRLDSLSVLIVDDNVDSAESAAALLLLSGCHVRVVTSGADALVAVAANTPDVVLLDIRMPGMDGWEVARQLRARIVGKQPLIVATTGCGTEADRWRSADAGVDIHLVKPIDPTVLTNLLTRVGRILAIVDEPESDSDGV